MRKEPLPDYGDLMTADEFVTCCKNGSFIDYDGHGYWASETEMDRDQYVIPSFVVDRDGNLRSEFKPAGTHVMWFNK